MAQVSNLATVFHFCTAFHLLHNFPSYKYPYEHRTIPLFSSAALYHVLKMAHVNETFLNTGRGKDDHAAALAQRYKLFINLKLS